MGTRALLMVVMATNLLGCAGAVANAAINTAVAASVAGVRRANGDCFTICNPGSTCNKATGECDPIRDKRTLPCRGECHLDQKCESTYLGDKCVSAAKAP